MTRRLAHPLALTGTIVEHALCAPLLLWLRRPVPPGMGTTRKVVVIIGTAEDLADPLAEDSTVKVMVVAALPMALDGILLRLRKLCSSQHRDRLEAGSVSPKPEALLTYSGLLLWLILHTETKVSDA